MLSFESCIGRVAGYITDSRGATRLDIPNASCVDFTERRLAIPFRIQCPSPACGATCSAADAVCGRSVKCPKCGQTYVARPTFDGLAGDTKKSRPASNENPFPTLPAEFGRYRVLRLLGRGGMGAVYLADDSQLGRQVALKIPFFDASESPQRVERFSREARAAAVLQHPNICTVFDAGQIDGRPFITMAYVTGTPLEAEIDPDEGMGQASAAGIARAVALAIDYAHRSGTVHRDLKPANVMIAAGGEPVVMDFGLAKQVADADPNEAKLTRDGGIVGTPSYMSPEQVRGDAAVGPATDVYSLGVMLFEMLAGQTPYRGSIGVVMGQTLAAPVRSVWEFRPDADPRLEAACRRAMAKDPAARFPTMAAFADALDQYLRAPDSPPPPVATRQPLAPPPTPDRSPFDQMFGEPTPAFAPVKAKKGRAVRVALALAVLLAGIGASAAVVLRLETKDGTLLVEMDDPEVEARVKGGTLTLFGPDGKVRYTLAPGERDKRIAAGPYTVRVEGADGLTLDTPEFTLKKGDKVTVKVTLERKAIAKSEPASPAAGAKAVEFDDLGLPRAPRVTPLAAGGFAPLFNGKDLTGWTVAGDSTPADWRVGTDGVAVAGGPQDTWGFLLTERNYTDFALRLQFQQSAAGSKSGVVIRGVPFSRVGNVPSQCTVNINTASNSGAVLWSNNSVYEEPTRPAKLKPVGEWNDFELELRGQVLNVTVNGDAVQSVDLTAFADRPNALPVLKQTAGRLGLQKHTGDVRFRNVAVKDLTAGRAARPDADPDRTAAAEAWSERLKGLPADQVPDALAARLRERNPGFDGKIEPTLEDGKFVGLSLEADQLADISPVRAVTGLQKLSYAGSWPKSGRLTDLAPLRGMKLTHLSLFHTPVSDLSPLRGMPLTDVMFSNTDVADLSALRGAKLTSLQFNYAASVDLSPVRDAGLTRLMLWHSALTDDGLIPLEGMTGLRTLYICGCRVTDAGMARLKHLTDLEVLYCARMPLTGTGLSHVMKMSKLQSLHLDDTQVTDDALANLQGLRELRELDLNQTRVTDAGLVRLAGLKKLTRLLVRKTAVTEEGVAKLKVALPECAVER